MYANLTRSEGLNLKIILYYIVIPVYMRECIMNIIRIKPKNIYILRACKYLESVKATETYMGGKERSQSRRQAAISVMGLVQQHNASAPWWYAKS